MNKYILIVVFISVLFGQKKPWEMEHLTKSSKRFLFTNYYLSDINNYKTLSDDVREVIDSELNIIFNNTNQIIQNLIQYKVEKFEEELGPPIFNRNAWIEVCLMKGLFEGDPRSEALKIYFYSRRTITKKVIENRKFELYNGIYNAKPNEIDFNTIQPTWEEAVNRYGYAGLGEKDISKSKIKELKLINRYFSVEFIDENRCILFSKYYGTTKGFEYFDLKEGEIFSHYGTYIIESVNWDILNGRNPPQLIIDIEGHKINIDLFKIEPKAQGAIKKIFNQYFNIINDMLYDLVGEKIEIKKNIDADNFFNMIEKGRKDALFIEDILSKLKQNFIADNFQPIEKYINGKYDKKVKHKKKKNGINITIRSNEGRYATLFKNNQLYSRQKDKGLTGHLFPFKNVEKNTKYLLLLENRITHYFKIIDAKDEDIELSVYDDFKRIEEIKNNYALKNWKPFSYNWKNYYPLVLEFINANQNFSQYQNLSLNYYGELLGHLTFIEECEKEHPSLINDCLKTNGRYKELFKNRINFYK